MRLGRMPTTSLICIHICRWPANAQGEVVLNNLKIFHTFRPLITYTVRLKKHWNFALCSFAISCKCRHIFLRQIKYSNAYPALQYIFLCAILAHRGRNCKSLRRISGVHPLFRGKIGDPPDLKFSAPGRQKKEQGETGREMQPPTRPPSS